MEIVLEINFTPVPNSYRLHLNSVVIMFAPGVEFQNHSQVDALVSPDLTAMDEYAYPLSDDAQEQTGAWVQTILPRSKLYYPRTTFPSASKYIHKNAELGPARSPVVP